MEVTQYVQAFTRGEACADIGRFDCFAGWMHFFPTGPTAQPTTLPSISPSVIQPFQIEVQPQQLKGFSIPGQSIVFLVTIAKDSQVDSNIVEISAEAKDASVSIEHKNITNSQVAEVTVIPSPASAGKSIEVNFTGTRGSLTAKNTVIFDVIEGEDDRKVYAAELLDKFVDWLSRNRPEFNLSSKTQWIGTMVSPQWLVVSHYIFFSEEWEMHVQWHIMIAPDDWARIDLRRRFSETKPSSAFEISSRSTSNQVKPIAVPDVIWR